MLVGFIYCISRREGIPPAKKLIYGGEFVIHLKDGPFEDIIGMIESTTFYLYFGTWNRSSILI